MATQSFYQISPNNEWSNTYAQTDGLVVRNGDQISWRHTIGTEGDVLREAAAENGFGSATLSGCTITGGPLYEDDLVKTVTITASAGQSWSASIALTHDTTSNSLYPTGDPSSLYLAIAAQQQGVQNLQSSFPNAYSVLMSNNPATGLPWLDASGGGTVTSLDYLEFTRYPLGLHSSANTARIEAALAHLQTNINSVEASISGVSRLYPVGVKTFTISGTVAAAATFGFELLDDSSPQKTIIDSTANPKLFQELARNVVIRLWPTDNCNDGTNYNTQGFVNQIVVDLPGVTSQSDLDNNYLIERTDKGTVGGVGSAQQEDWTHKHQYHSPGKIKFTWGTGNGSVDSTSNPAMKCFGGLNNYPVPSLNPCSCDSTDDILNQFSFYAINKTLDLSSAAVDSHGIEVKNANGKTLFNSNTPSQVAVFRGTVNGSEEPFDQNFYETVIAENQVGLGAQYLGSEWVPGHCMHVPDHIEGGHIIQEVTANAVSVDIVDWSNIASTFTAGGVNSYSTWINYYSNVMGSNNAGYAGWDNVTDKFLVAIPRRDNSGTAYNAGWADGSRYGSATVNGNPIYLTYFGPERIENEASNSFFYVFETGASSILDTFELYEASEDISNLRGNGATITLTPTIYPSYWTDIYIRPQSQFTGDFYIYYRDVFRTLNPVASSTGFNTNIRKIRPKILQVCDGNAQSNSTRNVFDVVFTVNSKGFGDIDTTGGTGIVNSPSGTSYGLDVQTAAVHSHTSSHPTQQMTAFTTKTRTIQIENAFVEDLRSSSTATTSGNKVLGTSSVKRYLNGRTVLARDVFWNPKVNRQLSWKWAGNNDIRIKFGTQNSAFTYDDNTWLGPLVAQIVNFGDGM